MRDHRSLPKWFRAKGLEISLGVFCTVLIVLTNFINVPLLNSLINQLDAQIYDQMVKLNWRPHQQNPRVVIIDIDEQSVQHEGRWPWPRDKMALLINTLKQDGVVTIALDIVMPEAEVNYASGLRDKVQQLSTIPPDTQKNLILSLNQIAPQVDNDQIFAQSLMDHSVVLGFLFHNDSQVKEGALPLPLNPPNINKFTWHSFPGYDGSVDLFIKSGGKSGFVTDLPDSDGTIRHSFLLAKYNQYLYPSLALATAMNYLLVDQISLVTEKSSLNGIDLNGLFIPTDSQAQVLIPFWGPPGTLDYYSATDILKNKIAPKELQGSIAIIGSTMALLGDLHQSPVVQLFPGVEMVANIIQAIIGQQLTTQYTWKTLNGILFLFNFGLIFSFLIPFLKVIGKLILMLAVVTIILISCLFLFVKGHLYIPSAMLVLLALLQFLISYSCSFIFEKHQRRKISQLFGQYVPEDYVKELIELPENSSMEGQTREMTVLFCDIRNFTSISETLDAVGVKDLLNTFFTPVTEIIFSNRGTIDKYVGDMIIAFWGAPIKDEEHAYHAIVSSLAIFKQLPEINKTLLENNLPVLHIGVGLSRGLMNVGDMGSKFRRAYTVLGDTVNLASRLQELTKFYKVDILVNDKACIGQDNFIWRCIDKITAKGRKAALNIYQPLCTVSEASPELLTELKEYQQGLNEYYARNWHAAEKRFNDLKASNPNLYLYELYIDRCTFFKNTPPPPEWDGTFIHVHK